MAFNFGMIGDAIEAAKSIDTIVDFSPAVLPDIDLEGDSLSDVIMNIDRIYNLEGTARPFVWGHGKWGEKNVKVTE